MHFLQAGLLLAGPLIAVLSTHRVSAKPVDVNAKSNCSTTSVPSFFYKGHDLSSLGNMETEGYSFTDSANGNIVRPAEDILAAGGMNTVRLRIWVADTSTYNRAYTLSLAKRFAQKGQRIYLDFHFSDDWADGGKQPTPPGWPTELPALSHTLRKYVTDTLIAFHDAGVQLDIVSLGNEIRHGFLWPTGRVDPMIQDAGDRVRNYTDFATLWSAARNGVRDAARARDLGPIQVMIHIDNGWDQAMQENWFGALIATGLVKTYDFDLMGFSFYPFYNAKATFKRLAETFSSLVATYKKDVMVVETNWPVVCDGKYNPIPDFSEKFPISAVGQKQWVAGVIDVLRAVPGGHGRGIFYWEPTWTTNSALGSACEDNVLFAGEGGGKVAPSRESMDMFLY
ncbi:hypothetical protein HDU88_002468 [Geranomyces variabilis]|nr:hypothetical protein HDU88_002468 [Geranomyces variabilis]